MTGAPDHSPFSSTFNGDGARIGVVLSHGVTGSPHGLRAWAQSFADAKDWAGAINVYENAVQSFPDNGTLKQNLAYCKEQLGK